MEKNITTVQNKLTGILPCDALVLISPSACTICEALLTIDQHDHLLGLVVAANPVMVLANDEIILKQKVSLVFDIFRITFGLTCRVTPVVGQLTS